MKFRRPTVVEWLVIVAIVGVLFLLFLPPRIVGGWSGNRKFTIDVVETEPISRESLRFAICRCRNEASPPVCPLNEPDHDFVWSREQDGGAEEYLFHIGGALYSDGRMTRPDPL